MFKFFFQKKTKNKSLINLKKNNDLEKHSRSLKNLILREIICISKRDSVKILLNKI